MMYHTRTANWCYKNGNLWDLRVYYVQKNPKSQIFISILSNLAVASAKADGAGEGNRTLA